MEMMNTGRGAGAIIEEKGLEQLSDAGELGRLIDEVLSDHENVVDDYRSGKRKAFGFLVGQVMKKTRGKANPELVNELLNQKIGG
jgi:aspartyl-tRNA(Asn)/glutamyl-tRNA(Gln) amidotransferase subunit B